MALDPIFYAVAVPAVLFAGISKGGFGSGAGFAASALLALIVEPALAVGFMLPLLMLIDVAALRAYWGGWSWPHARLLLLGVLPGTALGAALWHVANDDFIRVMLGVISLAFVAWQVARAQGWIRVGAGPVPRWGGVLAGTVAGFTSFVSHAGGPPVAVYLLAQRLEKTLYQATTVLVFWVVNLVKVIPYAYLGIFSAESLTASLFLAPVALIGAWCGVWAHRLVSERLFFGITYVLLTVTGTKLIWDALT